jgi:hypothetical protein
MSDLITERWFVFNHIGRDELWWRFDIMIGTSMGQGLLFPSRGAWRLSDRTAAMIEKMFPRSFTDIRAEIKTHADDQPFKLTMHGPLRDHRSEDHEVKEIDVEVLANATLYDGPQEGWA